MAQNSGQRGQRWHQHNEIGPEGEELKHLKGELRRNLHQM